MTYDYIKQAYGLTFTPGERVQHKETHEVGTVAPESLSQAHYVQVRFDRHGKRALPCHPRALDKVVLSASKPDDKEGG